MEHGRNLTTDLNDRKYMWINKSPQVKCIIQTRSVLKAVHKNTQSTHIPSVKLSHRRSRIEGGEIYIYI